MEPLGFTASVGLRRYLLLVLASLVVPGLALGGAPARLLFGRLGLGRPDLGVLGILLRRCRFAKGADLLSLCSR